MKGNRLKFNFLPAASRTWGGMFVAAALMFTVGCGTGELVQYLPEGVEYLGFDPNEAYLRVARRLHGRFVLQRSSRT